MNRAAAAQVANPGSAGAAGPTTGLTQAPARGGGARDGPSRPVGRDGR